MYRYTIGEQTPKGSIAGGVGEMNIPVMIDNRLSITYDAIDIDEVEKSQTLIDGGNSPMKLRRRMNSPRAGSMKNKDEEFVMFNDFPI